MSFLRIAKHPPTDQRFSRLTHAAHVSGLSAHVVLDGWLNDATTFGICRCMVSQPLLLPGSATALEGSPWISMGLYHGGEGSLGLCSPVVKPRSGLPVPCTVRDCPHMH